MKRPINNYMKLYLGLITQNAEKDIEELTSVYDSFDGLAAVVHEPCEDNTFNILESRKKEGFVIKRPFLYHHAHSMNEFLFNPAIKMGDWICLRDSAERLNPTFAADLKSFVGGISAGGIESVWHKGKLLLFRRWFNQQFFNGLHWGLYGAGPGIQLPDEDERYAYSVRNKTRPKDHRYRHEVFYLINYGANGNHLQLFWNNPKDLEYHQKEFVKFLDYLSELGCYDVDEWGIWLKHNKMNARMSHFINLERPLRNYYRYYILNHTNEEILKDEDTWRIV